MTIPVELSLRRTADGPRLCAEPVRELAGLYGAEHRWADQDLTADEKALVGVRGELFRIVAEIEPGGADAIGFVVRGVPVRYDATHNQLVCRNVKAPLVPVDGKIALDILVDRGSIEIFANHGQVALSVGGVLDIGEQSVRPEVIGRGAKIRSLKVIELKSAWK
jgi:sucrose-6-phosphate hydrolase SacC (GH32 family)